jgi:hypothetical protein
MQETIDVLTAKNSQLLAEREVGDWIRGSGDCGEANNDFTALVQKYITEIEELRAKLCESEMLAEQVPMSSIRGRFYDHTFGEFCPFSAKQLAFFLKNQFMIKILQKLAVV